MTSGWPRPYTSRREPVPGPSGSCVGHRPARSDWPLDTPGLGLSNSASVVSFTRQHCHAVIYVQGAQKFLQHPFFNTIDAFTADLIRALVGEGPSSLFAIYLKLLRRSSRNFQYPLIHSFCTLCSKIVLEPMIDWPQMTSEWRHFQSFSAPKKVLREELSCLQFWR